MKKESCYFYATISKTFKTNGTVIIKNSTGLQEISKEEPVFIEFNEILVPFFMESMDYKNDFHAEVKFESLHSDEQAMEYIGKTIYRKKYGSIRKNEFDATQMVGFTGFDQHQKHLGTITGIHLIPGNPVLVFEKEKQEFLIPFHEELILDLDVRKRNIVLDIPEGLLEI